MKIIWKFLNAKKKENEKIEEISERNRYLFNIKKKEKRNWEGVVK